ncbi:sigma-70 family RNA polymerase sigma factor [Kitasatospora sp. NPDC058965]|uniref:sigma-70 family RNA polymerase sigma factor n=1 Tax=Kitasatospora sp. NPDC058965 TaxID=3346682 RepID=UPI0036BC7FA8
MSQDLPAGTEGGGEELPLPFQAFFMLHHQAYLDYARAQLSLSEDEQITELVEDVFTELAYRWEEVMTSQDPAAYAWRMLRFIVEEERRHRGEALVLIERAVFMVAANRVTRPVFDALEDGLGIYREIARLPERQYDALLFNQILGYSTAQTAAVMGIKASTVRVLVHQVHEKFRRHHPLAAAPDLEEE